MPQYRKKPVVIEAVQWTGDNVDEIINLTKRAKDHVEERNGFLYIETMEGIMKAKIGDFIIRGVNNELYPCKPDIFHKTYEKVK